jgi:hypothetical protein
MYRFLSIFFLSALQIAAHAQGSIETDSITKADCRLAKDSANSVLKKRVVSYYSPVKFQPGFYNFIVISSERYVKTLLPKGQPSIAFVNCYNMEVKKALDSIYKPDFFKNEDSILHRYDLSGRGYRNAEFPGGAGAMQKYLDKNVSIPKETMPGDGSKTIRIYYSFLVDENGNTSDFKLVKSNCKPCEDSILAALKKMPPFIPAIEAGTTKKIRYVIPYRLTKGN